VTPDPALLEREFLQVYLLMALVAAFIALLLDLDEPPPPR
jgi:hypothetical protein